MNTAKINTILNNQVKKKIRDEAERYKLDEKNILMEKLTLLRTLTVECEKALVEVLKQDKIDSDNARRVVDNCDECGYREKNCKCEGFGHNYWG